MVKFIKNKQDDLLMVDNFCVFCNKMTDTLLNYHYFDEELDKREIVCPSHISCYVLRIIWFYFRLTCCVIIILILLSFIEALIFFSIKNILKLPVWLLIFNIVISLLFAGYIGIKLFLKFERPIRDYERKHTDYEDYYKSDRKRRRGWKDW